MTTSLTHPATDPACPVYTIETIAALFGVKVDTAREYSYRSDFPQPRALGARNLWEREEVLAWFSALPRRPRRVVANELPAPVANETPTPASAPMPKTYRRRSTRRAS